MKIKHTGTTTFTPTINKLVVNGVALAKKDLYLVVNATRNVIMYNFADSTLNSTSFLSQASPPSTEIILSHDTTSYSSTDQISVFYDNGVANEFVEVKNLPEVQKTTITNNAGAIQATISQNGVPQSTDTALIVGLHPSGNKTQTTLTDSAGTATATVKLGNTPATSTDPSLVVALHPTSPAMVGQGGSAVGTSNPLQVSLANTGTNASALNIGGNVGLTISTAQVGGNSETRAGNLVQVAPTAQIPSVSLSNALLVKNVNMVRLSGDTFVEERRPDYNNSGEYNGVAQNQLIMLQPTVVAGRRIRLFQIMFTFRYQGSSSTSDRGIFHFQFYPSGYATTGGTGNTGTYDSAAGGGSNVIKARLLSDQTHTLTFPYGVMPPNAGASLRVANVGGGALDMNWIVSFSEE